MAVEAQVVGLLPVPRPGSSSVDAVSPIPVFGPVALAAQQVGLSKRNRLAVAQGKKVVTVGRVMTVETPDSDTTVIKLHVLVDQQIFTPLEIYREVLFRAVTSTARGYRLGQRLQRDRKLLFGSRSRALSRTPRSRPPFEPTRHSCRGEEGDDKPHGQAEQSNLSVLHPFGT